MKCERSGVGNFIERAASIKAFKILKGVENDLRGRGCFGTTDYHAKKGMSMMVFLQLMQANQSQSMSGTFFIAHIPHLVPIYEFSISEAIVLSLLRTKRMQSVSLPDLLMLHSPGSRFHQIRVESFRIVCSVSLAHCRITW